LAYLQCGLSAPSNGHNSSKAKGGELKFGTLIGPMVLNNDPKFGKKILNRPKDTAKNVMSGNAKSVFFFFLPTFTRAVEHTES
jgi:hypothetical protein